MVQKAKSKLKKFLDDLREKELATTKQYLLNLLIQAKKFRPLTMQETEVALYLIAEGASIEVLGTRKDSFPHKLPKIGGKSGRQIKAFR